MPPVTLDIHLPVIGHTCKHTVGILRVHRVDIGHKALCPMSRKLKTRNQTAVDNDTEYKKVVTQRQQSQREVTKPRETNMILDDCDAVASAALPKGWQE